MKVSPAKENILKKVRNALSQSVQLPFPNSEGNNFLFVKEHDGLEMKFAEEWGDIHCQTPALIKDLQLKQLPSLNKGDMHTADAAITDCEMLVARTGTIVLSAAQPSGRALPVYTPVHLVIAYTHQLVFDLKDAITRLKDKYQGDLPSSIHFASGPSRTADIEKTLVVGIHGPKEVYVFLVDE